ncbi:DUF4175 family protein [Flammeovirgaceae bacterium SG7u.111]|nr:DUF4175 family protein [Flammeovirgaceae bacterium SG7u.132]WPO35510.1 DUF4175 family protein [Flammeovirgaceae bacterium SG7u.111]
MINSNLNRFKQKYYLNSLLKGSISVFAVSFTAYYLVNILEYLGNFSSVFRGILFYSFILTLSASFYYWVIRPLYRLLNRDKQLDDFVAAKKIGDHFPEINDKLVNTLQLQKLKTEGNDLVLASIQQREEKIDQFDFTKAVDYSSNKRYLKFIAFPAFSIFITLLFVPQLFTESTPRLVNYEKTYAPKAPFDFIVQNDALKAFKGENFELKLKYAGSAIPQNTTIITEDGRKLKMSATDSAGQFSFLFKKIQKNTNFHFEASGFKSANYNLEVLARPSLRSFNVYLDYPKYIGKENERLDNNGNLIVPEGTNIKWQFNTLETNNLQVNFPKRDNLVSTIKNNKDLFEFGITSSKSETYQLLLTNEFSSNKDIIEYYINVIPDEFPSVNMQQYEDTVLYDYLVLGGNIGDDYGITNLTFNYKVLSGRNGESKATKSIRLNFNPNAINQSFFYQFDISKLDLSQGDELEYYVEVWDNDAVNGRKSSKSSTFNFKLPSKAELKEAISQQTEQTQEHLEESLEKAKNLKKEIKDIQDKLKGKRKLDWQDKQNIEKLAQKHEELQKEIEKLKQLNKMFDEKKEKFNAQNEEISQKAEQLQKLMDELLDEETKKLYEELQKLMMEQNFINPDFQEMLDQIEMKEETIEKELDRALELFKQLKFDNKANEIIKDLEELAEKQKELAEETEEAKNSELEEIEEKQKELNEEFEEIQKELEELEEINETLESPKDIEQLEKEQEQIEQEQQQASENLQQKKQNKASESQQKMSKDMKKMGQKMQQMQQSMQMQQITENYDDLRKILENLIKLSFDQEDLMLDFQKVKRIDPKFVELGQQQLKLKDDAKIIEDSLVSLSKRVFEIESFVTREVSSMNKYMDESLESIRKRSPEIAASKQQFAMTSINNLALLLNDILKSMQNQMSMAMSGQQMSEKQGGMPNMSDLQKQLNQKIQNLKKSGKSGRALSEQLAKLAAEQEMIRNAMKKSMEGQKGMGKGKQQGGAEGGDGQNGEGGNPNGENENPEGKGPGEEKGGKEGGNGYDELLKKMEETEEDLVNKRITNELIERQQEILTRLLESEKAEKERELDKQREAKTAEQNKNQASPNDFSEYLKLKEMQIELLKTIPTSLNQYYKKEVNEYFKKIKE